MDDNKNIVYGGGLSDIRIKETYILSKSSELYQNDAPCIIIRTKLMNRVYEALREFIKSRVNNGKQEIFSADELPEEYREAIDMGEGKYVMMEVS